MRWILNLLAALVAKLWGTTKQMASTIAKAYSLGPNPVTAQRKTVCFRSRRHGLRVGREIGRDNSGRVVICLDGYPQCVHVRRQPHILVG